MLYSLNIFTSFTLQHIYIYSADIFDWFVYTAWWLLFTVETCIKISVSMEDSVTVNPKTWRLAMGKTSLQIPKIISQLELWKQS
jgi:hypothetical protein